MSYHEAPLAALTLQQHVNSKTQPRISHDCIWKPDPWLSFPDFGISRTIPELIYERFLSYAMDIPRKGSQSLQGQMM
jgi:hypothetical protein